MKAKDRIAAYCRISVDDDLDNDNVSIENQKSIISAYVKEKFPDMACDFYEDRDKSGYSFEERDGYQEMRKKLFNGYYKILIIKNFSRFSRRNSLGLYELELLRDAGVRIISIQDNIDFPNNADWLQIQFKFLMNEQPVNEASKNVRGIIKNRQRNAEWVCNAPYGYYLHPLKKNTVCIDEEGAAVVRKIFELYLDGWGYKRIANYLTEHNAPTGRMLMVKHALEREKDPSKINPSPVWSIVSVSKIISNDFYIGTLRQNVWTRAGINKRDVRTDPKDHMIFENHHEPIIEKEVFEKAQEIAKHRTTSHYKGKRKYEIPYSGRIYCADCGAHMFSISNPKRPNAYFCGSYHRRGLKACTSHHIHESKLNEAVKNYIRAVKENLQDKLININLDSSKEQVEKNKMRIVNLQNFISDKKSELAISMQQRIKQIAKNPENEESLDETFDIVDNGLRKEIENAELEIEFLTDESEKRKEIKNNIDTVLDTFNHLLSKERFTEKDIELIIDRITVDEDKTITIFLKSSITDLIDLVDRTQEE